MSLPENPQSRGEVFLNAIATGSSSDLPTPQSREEQYLDYIAQNGGGGGGTTVVANPTLAGTEDSLTGLQVGDTKYAVSGGGGGGGVLVVSVTFEGETATLDKTWQEITDASFPVIVTDESSVGTSWNTIRSTYLYNGVYYVEMVVGSVEEGKFLSYVIMNFTTDSASGYPSMSMGG